MSKNKREQTTIQLVINGQQAKTTLRDIRAATISVERELNNMKKDDDPAGWKKQIATLQRLKKAQADVAAEMRGGEASLNRFKTNWKDIAMGLVGGAGVVGALNMARAAMASLMSLAGTFSDELSDIQKTTGLSAEAARELNSDLQKIKTRTPVEELRRLAEEAGRLGFDSREDILGFVRAADMIQVALGDVLGDDATKDMAKIVDIFKLDDIYGVEGGLLRVGSAINEIGMASTANEGYVVDFIKRMSGISGIANVSVEELIALGGTLDSLGQSAEVGSTALSKVLVKMGSDVSTYARMAGEDVDDFRKVMERSAMEGLLLVLKNVGKTTDGIEALSATLGDLGLDGGRVVGILGTLAKNTDEYTRQLGISTSAMREGTSVADEFAVKNNNLAAVMDKVGKFFKNAGENLVLNFIEPAVLGFGRLTGFIDDGERSLAGFRREQNRVTQMESRLNPLIDRYEVLTSKTTRSKEEQEELKVVLGQLTDALPEAVTQWDAHGNAISLSADKAREAIAVHRQLLQTLNKDLIRDNALEINRYEHLLPRLEKLSTEQVSRRDGRGGRVMANRTAAERAPILAQIEEVRTKLAQLKKERDELMGVTPEPAAGTPGITPTGGAPTGGAPTGGDKGTAKEGEKRKKAIQDAEREIHLAQLSADEREIQQARWKYEQLRNEAKGHTEELKRINAMEVKDLAQINQKQQKAWLANADKSIRAQLVKMNQFSKEKSDFEREQTDATLKASDRDAEVINRKYTALLEQYKQYGMDTASLYTQWAAELQEVTEKAIATTAKRLDAAIKKDKKDGAEDARTTDRMLDDRIRGYQAMGDVMTSVLQISASNREENAKFEAQMAVYQLAIDSAVAVSSTIALAAKSSTTVWDLIASIGASTAMVLSGIARAKALFEEANAPQAPAFRADGGPTDLRSIYMDKTGNPEGYVNRPTFYSLGRRSYVAGEAGQEYVISNAMLKNPAVADFASMLEALRTQRYFANGGYTGQLPTTGGGGGDVSFDPRLLAEMQEQNRILRGILAKPTDINYDVFERYSKQVESIRGRASA